MGDTVKPALHGRDNRDDAVDQISGPWFLVLDAGDTPPDGSVEDEDYVFLQNGWAQPVAPLEAFAFRRGLSKLDMKGHLDGAGASSGSVAVTLPEPHRLPNDQFFLTVLEDATPAMVYLDSATGEVTITFPV